MVIKLVEPSSTYVTRKWLRSECFKCQNCNQRSLTYLFERGINETTAKEKPRELALIGVYSLTRSNPATKCAPCIKSMIVCCYPSAYSFRRLPSGVLDLILICQQSSLARVTCSLSGVLYIILMFSPFLVQRCPLSFLSSNHPSYYCVHSMSILLSMPIIHPE